jgi:hypothetical protein
MLTVVIRCGSLKVSLKTHVGVDLEVHSIESLALAREKPPTEEDNTESKTLK